MAHQMDLQTGQRLMLENAGSQTVVTLSRASLGQQQQSSQSIYTGTWTAPPRAYRTAEGVLIHLQTTEGDRALLIQNDQIQVSLGAPTEHAHPVPMQEVMSSSSMPPMQPMEPMPPMKPMGTLSMGNMQMSMNPMEMRMGDMTLSMGAASESKTQSASRFCSQCGTPVKESDRFCASCGHQLGT